MIPWEAAATFFILFLYAIHILAFLPDGRGALGHDWQYVLPSFLDGYYSAITEGYFHIPWFTPAFCGGVPKFPNPQDQYFTLPQILMFFLAPVNAVRITVLCFGAAGFAGMYLLLRSVFRCGAAAALLGATVFLFNGFYSVGMIMGHFNKHGFMLLPLCALLLLKAGSQNGVRAAAAVSAVAVCFAYMVYAGAFMLLLIMCAAIAGIGLLAVLRGADFRFSRFAAFASASAALALPLSAAKLAAVSAFMHSFPRDFYSLPGIPRLADMPVFLLTALFGDSAPLAESSIFVSEKWVFAFHEFNFGITWVPAVLIAAGCVAWLKEIPPPAKMRGRMVAAAAAFCFIMAVPAALNYLSPGWHGFLKSVPVIKNSSGNLRWLAVYIPVLAVLSALALEKVFRAGAAGTAAGIFCIAAVAAISMLADRSYYLNHFYNPNAITTAYAAAKKSGAPPRINGVAAFVTNGVPVRATGRNDFLVIGKSSFLCYEPVFGYLLESFPFKTLHLGPVADVTDGALNLKNPACFVFPAENGCFPGDHFKTGEEKKVLLFTQYRDFEFNISARQRIANAVSMASWILLAAGWLYVAARKAAARGF